VITYATMDDGPPISIDHPFLDGGASHVGDSNFRAFEATEAVTIDDSTPTIGMSFRSVEDCKSFYRQYAIKLGFGIKTRNSKKG